MLGPLFGCMTMLIPMALLDFENTFALVPIALIGAYFLGIVPAAVCAVIFVTIRRWTGSGYLTALLSGMMGVILCLWASGVPPYGPESFPVAQMSVLFGGIPALLTLTAVVSVFRLDLPGRRPLIPIRWRSGITIVAGLCLLIKPLSNSSIIF